jgi:hypothetical protein
MRIIIAATLFFLYTIPVKAQMLDFLDLPVVNELWIEFKDTVGANMFITSPGSGQTWNYSSIFSVHDTIQYLQQPLVTAPPLISSQFPLATSVTAGSILGDYTFYKTGLTGMYITGDYISAGFDVFGNQYNLIKYTNDLLYLPVPFDTGSVVQNTAAYSFVFPDSSLLPNAQVRITYSTFQDFEADAQGALTTPLGSYNSVIRIKEMITKSTLVELDSFSTGNFTYLTDIPYPTTYAYKWVKNGPNCLVMTAELNQQQQVTSVSYFTSSGLVGNAERQVETSQPQLYPNPLKSGNPLFINLNLNSGASLILYDLGGREMCQRSLQKGQLMIDDISLKAGIYFARIFTESSNTQALKLIVVD